MEEEFFRCREEERVTEFMQCESNIHSCLVRVKGASQHGSGSPERTVREEILRVNYSNMNIKMP